MIASGLFDEVAVPPAPGDSGTAIGAAAAVHLGRHRNGATGHRRSRRRPQGPACRRPTPPAWTNVGAGHHFHPGRGMLLDPPGGVHARPSEHAYPAVDFRTASRTEPAPRTASLSRTSTIGPPSWRRVLRGRCRRPPEGRVVDAVADPGRDGAVAFGANGGHGQGRCRWWRRRQLPSGRSCSVQMVLPVVV
ncbi:hypothetical protein ACIRD3_20085 [Kitasatospora sp. NPDC093550]|uniref:hypothetical protein n=1 Tax=Kitasatospora sp. NPDC093550 TaxID=3364089 RepID=UPI0038260AE8